ncbi:prolipoprotein diacylglyceryl transferase [Blattabacterium cuenoti]|uniref:prolipoprotein diacylglyceryl transferase n=1 Tax=Blattabacterium cuenoti TaxID=1653831 RepID=UPI00163BC41E|nr:prolipoprotein diacylglyceryl transferase [Blattabacterium cuenoti]
MNLLIYIDWDPIYKFYLWKEFPIYVYSIMFIISFILGWLIMKYIYHNDNINCEYLDPLLRYTFFGTLIGARLGQVFFYDFLYFYDHCIEIFFPIKENKNNYLLGIIKGYEYSGYRGFSSHGAIIGVILSSFLYKKKFLKNKSFFWLCDRLCIISSISGVFIRIGNFFNSEIIGKPCYLPWGVRFFKANIETLIIPRHPTQIYESTAYLFTFLFLLYFYKKKKLCNGFLSGIFFILIWSFRFLIEFLKEPQGIEFIKINNLNTGQCLSIPFIIFGLFLIFFSLKK